MAGNRRVWHYIRDSKKTLCGGSLFFEGARIASDAQYVLTSKEGCKTCKKLLLKKYQAHERLRAIIKRAAQTVARRHLAGRQE